MFVSYVLPYVLIWLSSLLVNQVRRVLNPSLKSSQLIETAHYTATGPLVSRVKSRAHQTIARGPTRFQITYAFVEISFQNTKTVFKTQNQFSKQKISFQNTNPVLKTQITAQIHKISFQIVNTTNYKSVKLRFLSVMSSLLNAPLKRSICRRVIKQFVIQIFILYGA